MMKRGDMIIIALLFVNLAFIGLVITKGAFSLPAVTDTAVTVLETVDNYTSDSLITHPLPRVNTTPLAETTSSITLAVDNTSRTLIPLIQSSPKNTAQSPTTSPTITPGDDQYSSVDIPSYKDILNDKPQHPAVPSYKSVSKTKHKNNKK
jgi:hypothetical protein